MQSMRKTGCRLIAFDLDGTLLNKESRISAVTAEAIREAIAAGKQIVIATGRSVTEVMPYRKQFAGIRYGILESGALLYDFAEEEILKRAVFPRETLVQLEEVSHYETMYLQAMTEGRSLIEQGFVDWLAKMGVKGFRDFVDRCETIVPDLRAELLRKDAAFEKVNFYHLSVEALERTRERARHIKAEAALSAAVSLEMSPAGISKGTALTELAELIGIPITETIGVGDSGNDRTMLEAAGLAVAVANAVPSLKDIADYVCEEERNLGVEEALRRFVL